MRILPLREGIGRLSPLLHAREHDRQQDDRSWVVRSGRPKLRRPRRRSGMVAGRVHRVHERKLHVDRVSALGRAPHLLEQRQGLVAVASRAVRLREIEPNGDILAVAVPERLERGRRQRRPSHLLGLRLQEEKRPALPPVRVRRHRARDGLESPVHHALLQRGRRHKLPCVYAVAVLARYLVERLARLLQRVLPVGRHERPHLVEREVDVPRMRRYGGVQYRPPLLPAVRVAQHVAKPRGPYRRRGQVFLHAEGLLRGLERLVGLVSRQEIVRQGHPALRFLGRYPGNLSIVFFSGVKLAGERPCSGPDKV